MRRAEGGQGRDATVQVVRPAVQQHPSRVESAHAVRHDVHLVGALEDGVHLPPEGPRTVAQALGPTHARVSHIEARVAEAPPDIAEIVRPSGEVGVAERPTPQGVEPGYAMGEDDRVCPHAWRWRSKTFQASCKLRV